MLSELDSEAQRIAPLSATHIGPDRLPAEALGGGYPVVPVREQQATVDVVDNDGSRIVEMLLVVLDANYGLASHAHPTFRKCRARWHARGGAGRPNDPTRAGSHRRPSWVDGDPLYGVCIHPTRRTRASATRRLDHAAAIAADDRICGVLVAARLSRVEDHAQIAQNLRQQVIRRLFDHGPARQTAASRVQRSDVAGTLHKQIDEIDETISDIRAAIFSLEPAPHPRPPGGPGTGETQ